MAILNNYTYSSVSYQITEGDNVSGEIGTAVITLSPLPGYSLDVNNFSLGTSFSDPNVDSVVFTQNGDDIDITVTFIAGFVMPSSNYNVDLCIDGEAKETQVSISGVINATVGSNITGDSSETDTPYSATGLTGVATLLFSRTYSAASGYYISAEQILMNGESNPENYSIVETPVYDVDNNLTGITYDVYYTFPSESYINYDFQIIVSAKEIFVANQVVNRWTFTNKTVIPSNGGVRTLMVWGVPGATFSITQDDGSGAVTIVNNETLSASGQYSIDIQFDPIIVDTTYTFEISGDLATSLVTTRELVQYIPIDIEFEAIGIDFNLPSIESITTDPLLRYNESTTRNSIEFTWVITSSIAGTLALDRQPESSDISDFREVYATVDGSVSNSTTFDVVDASNLASKMEFNEDGVRLAPFDTEISNIGGNTVTCLAPVTLANGSVIAFTDNFGNYMSLEQFEASLDSNEVTITAKIYFTNFGKEGKKFTINLDNFISQS